MAVVNHRLRVRGMGGLRVIDASIKPTIISGNTAAPAVMIGEKGAALVREDRRCARADVIPSFASAQGCPANAARRHCFLAGGQPPPRLG